MNARLAAIAALLLVPFTPLAAEGGSSSVTYVQAANGSWTQGYPARAEDSVAGARVDCGDGGRAEIYIDWLSESGDWAVHDRYDARGPYLVREIRFAATPATVVATRDTPGSAPSVEVGEEILENYRYLVTEIETYHRPDAFPFQLPSCARAAFARRND